MLHVAVYAYPVLRLPLYIKSSCLYCSCTYGFGSSVKLVNSATLAVDITTTTVVTLEHLKAWLWWLGLVDYCIILIRPLLQLKWLQGCTLHCKWRPTIQPSMFVLWNSYCVSCTLQHCCAHCADTVASGILAKLAHSSHIGMVSPAHCTPLGHYICVQLMHCAVSNAKLIEALQCPMCNWETKPWNDCTKLIQHTVHLQHCCILDFSEVHFNPELCNVLMSPSITLHISE